MEHVGRTRSSFLFGALALSCLLAACRPELAPTLGAEYDSSPSTESYQFRWSDPSEPYLMELRAEFGLDALVAGAANDTERAGAICSWVHGLWQHDSSNTPEQSDPVSILHEVAEGERFRCVEYSIVVAGCLDALGIPSRTMGLKTRDVETRASGAGHVVAEAFLPDLAKWVLLDGQWGIIPFSGDTPLSAIELMRALAEADPALSLEGPAEVDATEYWDWISDYLYFYDVQFDNRVGDKVTDRDERGLMLVPLGERNPVLARRHEYVGDRYEYTHSAPALYAAP